MLKSIETRWNHWLYSGSYAFYR